MPALNRRLIRMQQNAPGRRRTSLEGRNRVMLPVRVEQKMLYGDLNYRSAVWYAVRAAWSDTDIIQATQAPRVGADICDFSLRQRAINGFFTQQDNGFPYRRWPMSVWLSSSD